MTAPSESYVTLINSIKYCAIGLVYDYQQSLPQPPYHSLDGTIKNFCHCTIMCHMSQTKHYDLPEMNLESQVLNTSLGLTYVHEHTFCDGYNSHWLYGQSQ